MTKASIIIPVYNSEKYLTQCLKSIINQTYKNIEIICINDGSTDCSPEILNFFAQQDERIIVINQNHLGTGIARNNGIKAASGKYLTFVDSDDWISTDAIEKFIYTAEKNNAKITRCNYTEYNEQTNRVKNYSLAHRIEKSYNYDLTENSYFCWRDLKKGCLYNYGLHVWANFYLTDFIKNNNIEFAPNQRAEDHIFHNSAVLLAEKVYYLGDYLYFYRNHADSTVNTKNENNFCVFDNIKLMQEFLKTHLLYDELKEEFYAYAKQVIEWHYEQTPKDCLNKFEELASKYFLSTKEFEKFIKRIKNKNSFIDNIFSIKSKKVCGIFHKIVTFLGVKVLDVYPSAKHLMCVFLGIKLKINNEKIVNRKFYKQFKNHKVRPKSILIIEPNNCHFETIPGYCDLLMKFGYNVDVLCRHYSQKIFSILDSKINIYECNTATFNKIFEKYNFKQYERIFYNSKRVYFKKNDIKCEGYDIYEYYKKIPKGKKDNIYVQHHIDKINEHIDGKQIILANPACDKNLEKLVVNSHYFGQTDYIKPKSNITHFISIGNLSKNRRNSNLLVNAILDLHKKGIDNFKITVIGSGEMDNIPQEIKPYFNILGYVDFPTMFMFLALSDYILPLLDPETEAQKRYMKDGTSGTFQLVYGFLKPCIINRVFGDIYGFDKTNALVYEKNSDLANSMQEAINITNQQYMSMQNNLKNKVEKIEKESLDNFRRILE